MKNLVLILFAVLLFGCKKEDPNPPGPTPTPVPVVPGANWFAVGTDTVWMHEFASHLTVSTGETFILGIDSAVSHGSAILYIPANSVDSLYLTGTSSVVDITNAGPTYNNLQMTLVITRYDAVGGLIEGWYDGVGYNSSVQYPIKGVFSVIRGPNQ